MNKNIIQKILLFIVLGVLYYPGFTVFANEKGDKILNKIDAYLLKKSSQRQQILYKKILDKIENFQPQTSYSKENIKILDYLTTELTQRYATLMAVDYYDKNTTSLILRFSNNSDDNNNYITEYYQNIEDTDNIFLFRYSKNLSSQVLKDITQKLYAINPDVHIFIDQEGGYINRYVSFDIKRGTDYLEHPEVSDLYINLSDSSKQYIRDLFTGEYFPSPAQIGILYGNTANIDRANFLRIVAYIILNNLSQQGIYHHGLVLDLDRGNPVITGLERSFSDDIQTYKQYIDAFTWASKQTGVTLYAKHFPGHGDGEIDSHVGILSYELDSAYVYDNLEIFEYFFNSKPEIQKGVMVGHMYIPQELEEEFIRILKKSDFILTDDLAMEGYQKTFSIKQSTDLFLTTSLLWDLEVPIIIVDTEHDPSVK